MPIGNMPYTMGLANPVQSVIHMACSASTVTIVNWDELLHFEANASINRDEYQNVNWSIGILRSTNTKASNNKLHQHLSDKAKTKKPTESRKQGSWVLHINRDAIKTNHFYIFWHITSGIDDNTWAWCLRDIVIAPHINLEYHSRRLNVWMLSHYHPKTGRSFPGDTFLGYLYCGFSNVSTWVIQYCSL